MAAERRARAKGGGAIGRRLVFVAIVAFAVWFAVQGGEFSTMDLLRQRRQEARIARTIDSLQRVVDSLRRYQAAVERDPVVQERIAREVFGMVRGDKEILYRFADSARAKR
jgi:cell division protein FtsB